MIIVMSEHTCEKSTNISASVIFHQGAAGRTNERPLCWCLQPVAGCDDASWYAECTEHSEYAEHAGSSRRGRPKSTISKNLEPEQPFCWCGKLVPSKNSSYWYVECSKHSKSYHKTQEKNKITRCTHCNTDMRKVVGAGGYKKVCSDCISFHEQERQRIYLFPLYRGINISAYNTMLKGQDYKCAICRLPLDMGKNTNLDHCHDTGYVRGILCGNCNRGIGNLKDNLDNLEAAKQYLMRSREQTCIPSEVQEARLRILEKFNHDIEELDEDSHHRAYVDYLESVIDMLDPDNLKN